MMNKPTVLICNFLLTFGAEAMMISPCKADLTSPLYAQAVQLYYNRQYREASKAFMVYEQSDRQWLDSHPETKAKIEEAIKDCSLKLNLQIIEHLTGNGAVIKMPSPGTLVPAR